MPYVAHAESVMLITTIFPFPSITSDNSSRTLLEERDVLIIHTRANTFAHLGKSFKRELIFEYDSVESSKVYVTINVFILLKP